MGGVNNFLFPFVSSISSWALILSSPLTMIVFLILKEQWCLQDIHIFYPCIVKHGESTVKCMHLLPSTSQQIVLSKPCSCPHGFSYMHFFIKQRRPKPSCNLLSHCNNVSWIWNWEEMLLPHSWCFLLCEETSISIILLASFHFFTHFVLGDEKWFNTISNFWK